MVAVCSIGHGLVSGLRNGNGAGCFGRQPSRNAHAAQHMTTASNQQHHFARLQLLLQGVCHACIFGQLDTGHGRDLGLGQQVAMAAANRFALALPGCRG